MATGLFIAAEPTKAQVNTIAYTDIDPDEMFVVDPIEFPYNAWDYYNLDFDNNAMMDVHFSGSVSTGYYPSDNYRSFSVLVNGFSANSIMAEMVTVPGGYSKYALVLNYGDMIDADQTWQTGNADMAFKKKSGPGSFWEDGYWLHADTNKYLGARFLIGSQYHYGWVRLDVADYNTLYRIKDYAYNTVPEQGLEAGQTELFTAVTNTSASASVSFAQSGSSIFVSLGELEANADIRIINALGQIVCTEKLHSGDTRIELPSHALYIVSVTLNGITYSKTMIL